MSSDSGPSRLQLFGLALLAGVLMIAASLVNRLADPGAALRVALAIVPVLPLAALAWAIMRAIASLDELQRRIQLDAIERGFCQRHFCGRDLWPTATRPDRPARSQLGVLLSRPARLVGHRLPGRVAGISMKNRLRVMRRAKLVPSGPGPAAGRFAADGQRDRNGQVRPELAIGLQNRATVRGADRADF